MFISPTADATSEGKIKRSVWNRFTDMDIGRGIRSYIDSSYLSSNPNDHRRAPGRVTGVTAGFSVCADFYIVALSPFQTRDSSGDGS